jgi:hypothetical protein
MISGTQQSAGVKPDAKGDDIAFWRRVFEKTAKRAHEDPKQGS